MSIIGQIHLGSFEYVTHSYKSQKRQFSCLLSASVELQCLCLPFVWYWHVTAVQAVLAWMNKQALTLPENRVHFSWMPFVTNTANKELSPILTVRQFFCMISRVSCVSVSFVFLQFYRWCVFQWTSVVQMDNESSQSLCYWSSFHCMQLLSYSLCFYCFLLGKELGCCYYSTKQDTVFGQPSKNKRAPVWDQKELFLT